MNTKITRLTSILIGAAFLSIPLMGQRPVKSSAGDRPLHVPSKGQASVSNPLYESSVNGGDNVMFSGETALYANELGNPLFTDDRAKIPDIQLRAEGQPWPDSTLTYDATDKKTGKTVYTYDADGRQTLSESYKWEGNKWVIANKSASTYDAAGNRTLSESFEWKVNAWVATGKYIYAYDATGHQTLYERYTWENNAWVGSYKYVYEYDAAGYQTLYEYYNWANNAWVGGSKQTYTYDKRGERATSVYYSWDNNQWVVNRTYYYDYDERQRDNPKVYVYHSEYPGGSTAIFISCFSWGYGQPAEAKYEYTATYDAKGNLILVETSGLGYDGNDPRSLYQKYIIKYENDNPVSVEEYDSENALYRKVTYQYDAKGNNTLFESYQRDYDKNTLTLRSKNVYAYDAAGNQTLYEYYEDLEGTGQWTYGYKYVDTYDTSGNELSYEYYDWDTASKSWAGSGKTDYLRNEQGRTVKYKSYSWASKKWNLSSYTVYYPNSLPNGGVSNEVVTGAEVWGYGDKLHVRIQQPATLKVYTLSGALLRQQALSAGEEVVSLPRGIYLVQVGNAVKKVAIQ